MYARPTEWAHYRVVLRRTCLDIYSKHLNGTDGFYWVYSSINGSFYPGAVTNVMAWLLFRLSRTSRWDRTSGESAGSSSSHREETISLNLNPWRESELRAPAEGKYVKGEGRDL